MTTEELNRLPLEKRASLRYTKLDTRPIKITAAVAIVAVITVLAVVKVNNPLLYLIIPMIIIIIARMYYKFEESKWWHYNKCIEKAKDDWAVHIRKRRAAIYASQVSDLENRFGKIDKEIVLEKNELSENILVFGESKVLCLQGKEISFSDITGCQCTDNPSIKKGKRYIDDTSDDNVVESAIVGGLIGGTWGAVIGAATANKKTKGYVNAEPDQIIHDYTVYINVKSISNPTISVSVGNKGDKASEIVALINAIMEMNK